MKHENQNTAGNSFLKNDEGCFSQWVSQGVQLCQTISYKDPLWKTAKCWIYVGERFSSWFGEYISSTSLQNKEDDFESHRKNKTW